MADMRVSPGPLGGRVTAMPSKSQAHRAVICAALAEGESRISHIELSKDISATLACVEALGLADHRWEGETLVICGGKKAAPGKVSLPCGESGSTLRFIIPLAAHLADEAEFICEGRLSERPLEPLKSLLAKKGVTWLSGHRITGKPAAGEYALAGNVSSQFVSGLLFLLPLLKGDSTIALTTRLESAGYVAMTRQTQQEFGVQSRWVDERTLQVAGGQKYLPQNTRVEGDYSHAAFYAVAGALHGDIRVEGLREDSLQGDKAVLDILTRMGANICREADGTLRFGKSRLKGIDMDVSQTPDLVPALAVAAAAAQGTTRITGAGRLRIKECDRLSAVADALTRMGVRVEEEREGLIIHGGTPLKGAVIHTYNDHRMAMAMAVAATVAEGDSMIENAGCVAKSAPCFWQELASIGGKLSEQ
ncbi:MAG: 3-phosphoshikimate 1-carboxyvinyltransferase [Christensenellaceae bacterium]|nr:3-phosphoshikimate 1-carboxyvinyltransferase [Christensenellaceae bacterium]